MSITKITENISYIKVSTNPLSSDVGIVNGKDFIWLYDVGSSDFAAKEINSLKKQKNAVFSHFHPDHIGNMNKVDLREEYQSANTFRYTKRGIAFSEDAFIKDGIKIHLFKIPSSHAKGCVGMEVGEYAFLGDAIYCTVKNAKPCYNASILKEEIDLIKALKASYFLISHDEEFVKTKEEVIEELLKTYSKRNNKESYIYL